MLRQDRMFYEMDCFPNLLKQVLVSQGQQNKVPLNEQVEPLWVLFGVVVENFQKTSPKFCSISTCEASRCQE